MDSLVFVSLHEKAVLFCVNLPLELTNGTLPGVVAVGDVPTRLNKRLVLTAIIQNFGCVGSRVHEDLDSGIRKNAVYSTSGNGVINPDYCHVCIRGIHISGNC